jgi:hypothetical protein
MRNDRGSIYRFSVLRLSVFLYARGLRLMVLR